jgi:dipeptidyl aminopeptidase/acylaminoacyl peptidase
MEYISIGETVYHFLFTILIFKLKLFKMKTFLITLCFLGATLSLKVNAQQKPALSWKDVAKWRSINARFNILSPDGQWMAYIIGPVEGDQEVVIRKVSDTTIHRYPCGATTSSMAFSDDSKFMAFKISAKDADVKAAKKTSKTLYDKLAIVNLDANTKTEFERVNDFSFSGKYPDWVAIQFAALETAPKDKDAAKGTDLLLYNATTKKSFNVGSVNEFAFNKTGNLLAYAVDANGQNGNGVYLHDLKTGVTVAIDNDKARYKSIKWNEEGTAFALLKSNKNDDYKDEIYSVIGVSKLQAGDPDVAVYSSLNDKAFPVGMGISGDRGPYWSDNTSTLFFGTRRIEKSDKAKTDSTASGTKKGSDSLNKKNTVATGKDSLAKKNTVAAGKDSTNKKNIAAAKKDDIDKPDLIIWNWQDKHLQSEQEIKEKDDKAYSYVSEFQVATKHFIQLADSNMRVVNVAPKQAYAIGLDNSKYELASDLDGQSYSDIYVIDLNTGNRKLLFEKFYQNSNRGFNPAPNGRLACYYQDGAFYSVNLETGEKNNLTGKISASFVAERDDHNVIKPSTDFLGWSADSKYVFVKDNYDLWRIGADGKSAVSLTDNWKAKKIEISNRFGLYPDEKGIDLQKPQYFGVFDRNTKQSGIGKLDGNKINILFMDNNVYYNLIKATNSPVYAYSKENNEKSPEVFVTAAPDLSAAKQVTANTPDQSKYAWSSGAKLINYVSANGDTLQAALFLPANYEPGKAYPTITYIYERLTDGLYSYAMPAFPGGGFNRSVYTSNGYAVLMPDIKYKINDPGMSAVACVVPAVKAAIATGIVDAKRVAIHGHSWGGYQTSFLITQTNIFKAAAAGAPLTDMISMYSLIYGNAGITNQSIFEASQGRLTPGYWDNLEAFTRNSPIYHIKNVQTPLLLLHNDKDGAVNFTQGLEYYNGLRRLNKPVVMITYKGENHGIAKLPNRKDYAVRMMEYFDYMLKDKPAPLWWSKGVNHLDMDKLVEASAFDEGN